MDSFPFSLPCVPKQSGNLTLGLGSESIGYLVSKIGGTSSALWRKDCFPTSVQLGSKSKNGRFWALFGPGLDGGQWKSTKSIEINKISIENQEKSMPAAMESSQNIENGLEIYIFLQISSKMFFFWKSRKISPDLENLLRDLAGRARDLSAGLEISRPGRNPPNLTTPKNRFPALPLPSIFFWWDASF